MKTKKCIRRSIRLIELGIKRATSYEVVKNRLNYRLYSPDLLKERQEYENERLTSIQ